MQEPEWQPTNTRLEQFYHTTQAAGNHANAAFLLWRGRFSVGVYSPTRGVTCSAVAGKVPSPERAP